MKHHNRSGLLAAVLVSAIAAALPGAAAPAADQQANVYTYNRQDGSSIALNRAGDALVVWGSRRQEEGSYGIFGRWFDADGSPRGGELHLNTFEVNNQETPSVAIGPDDVAWVTWRSHAQASPQGAVIARRFDVGAETWTPLSDELVISPEAIDASQPVVAAADGRALIAWTDDHQVHAVLVDGDLQPLTLPARHASRPSVTTAGNGWIMTYATFDAEGRPAGLLGHRIDADGAVGAPVRLDLDAEERAIEPIVVADEQGAMLTWMSGAGSSPYAVMARRLDPDTLEARGRAVRLDTGSGAWRSGATVALDASGATVAWNEDGRIVRRDLDRDLNLMSAPTFINHSTRSKLASGSAAARLARRDGAVVAAWDGAIGEDGRGVGITWAGRPADDQQIAAAPAPAPQPTKPPVFDPDFVPEPREETILGPTGGQSFVGFTNTGWNPPDPHIAVGDTEIVVVVNGGISFFDKTGVQLFTDAIAGAGGFWGELGATSFVFDPIVLYDALSERFMVAAVEHDASDNDYLLFAVSDDATATGTWHKYRWFMNPVGRQIDFPNLSVGPSHVYLTTDFYTTPRGAWIHVVDKAAVLSGLATSPSSLQTATAPRAMGGAHAYDADAPAGYFASAFATISEIEMHAVTGPASAPSLASTIVTVPFMFDPPDAPQLGSTDPIDTVGKRLKSGVLRNGRLWYALTVGFDNRAIVRWMEIDPQGWPTSGLSPVLVQAGEIDPGAGIHTYFPAIGVDPFGNATVVFNRSSTGERVSIATAFRIGTDSASTMRSGAQLQVSTSADNTERWGDYGGIAWDPAAPTGYWIHHQYRTTSWRTWVAAVDPLVNIDPLQFEYPDGRPSSINFAGGTTLRVRITEQGGFVDPGTVRLVVNDGRDQLTTFAEDLGGGDYQLTFPEVTCGTIVSYSVAATTFSGRDGVDPPGAEYTALTIETEEVVLVDDFETDNGWTVSGDATDGHWDRGVPVGGGDRGDPPTDADGSGQCYLTDNVDGNTDVDSGSTILTSPLLDATGENPYVSYMRWFSTIAGSNPFLDTMTVEVSNDNGTTWVVAEVVGPEGEEAAGGWYPGGFFLADLVEPTNQVRVRFIADDSDPPSVIEAGLDAFELRFLPCPEPKPDCLADINGDAQVDFSDLLDVLADWGACTPVCNADLNGDDLVGFEDLLIVLAEYGPCDQSCPWDLNVDQIVGFDDLLTLLANFGCTNCAGDFDESGSVDFNDLVVLLANWGDCP